MMALVSSPSTGSASRMEPCARRRGSSAGRSVRPCLHVTTLLPSSPDGRPMNVLPVAINNSGHIVGIESHDRGTDIEGTIILTPQ